MKVELYGKRYYTDKSGCLYSDVLHYILGIPSVSLTQMYNMRQMIEERSQKGNIFMKLEDENRKLKSEVNDLKEQLQSYIPRRRVRRVYKQLRKILEQDIENDSAIYISQLKTFITNIEKNGKAVAGQDIKTAIEHLLSICEVNE